MFACAYLRSSLDEIVLQKTPIEQTFSMGKCRILLHINAIKRENGESSRYKENMEVFLRLKIALHDKIKLNTFIIWYDSKCASKKSIVF